MRSILSEKNNEYVQSRCEGCLKLKMNCNTGRYICQRFPIGRGYCMDAIDVLDKNKCIGFCKNSQIRKIHKTEINEDMLI